MEDNNNISSGGSGELYLVQVEGARVVADGLKSHTEFPLIVTHVHNNNTKTTVLRRYSHFYVFREELKQQYKGYLIPPIPDKQVLSNTIVIWIFLL